MFIDVAGYCPMGCGEHLHLSRDSGLISCLARDCPRPLAVTELLRDDEVEHTVLLTETSFTLKHPLRERLGEASLFNCSVHEFLQEMRPDDIAPPGKYRVTVSPDGDVGWFPL